MSGQKRLKKYDPYARKREYADIKSIAEEFYSRIPALGLNFYWVYNFQSRKTIHVSDQVTELTNLKPIDFYKYPNKLLGLIPANQHEEIGHYFKQTELYLYSKKDLRPLVINWQIGTQSNDGPRNLLLQIYPLILEERPKYLMIVVHDIRFHLGSSSTDSLIRYYILDKLQNRITHLEEKIDNPQIRSHLTPGEEKIKELITRGFKTREISDELGLSYHTVKTHRRNIRAKEAAQKGTTG